MECLDPPPLDAAEPMEGDMVVVDKYLQLGRLPVRSMTVFM